MKESEKILLKARRVFRKELFLPLLAESMAILENGNLSDGEKKRMITVLLFKARELEEKVERERKGFKRKKQDNCH